jgi:hypothetical protein
MQPNPCLEDVLYHGTQIEIPNCSDPVFRAWCRACNLQPGRSYSWWDRRVRMLEQYMQVDYDPESDWLDDPFQSELS